MASNPPLTFVPAKDSGWRPPEKEPKTTGGVIKLPRPPKPAEHKD